LARRIDTGTVVGLREHLIERNADLLAKLTRFDGFGADVDRLRDRLIDLRAGRDILVYRFEIPADMQPPRSDGQHVYTLRGDRLITAEYQRVKPVFDRW
jgi:hypothetical protein